MNGAPSSRGHAVLAAAFTVVLCLPAGAEAAYDPAVLDPDDFGAVQHVCTACHTTQRIFHVHSWTDWVAVFETMSGYGAKGTDADWDRIANFLQLTLTDININTAPPEEIGPVLGASDAVVQAIVARREKQKFSSIDDLETFPGIDAKRLEILKSRIAF